MQSIPTLTLADFQTQPIGRPPAGSQFRVYRLEEFITDAALAGRYSRKDFFKVTLSTGPATYYRAEQRWELPAGQHALVFTTTRLPYRWEVPALPCLGYCAVFSAAFLPAHAARQPADWPVFAADAPGFFYLTPAQYAGFAPLFEHMLTAQAGSYPQKYEVLFHYLLLVVHQTQQLLPPATRAAPATRLAAAFHLLLADQFPRLLPTEPLALRTAQDYADQLAVHVNSLNRAVKAATGRTTSQLLAERLGQEAQALLRHTDWTISQISHCLGFSEPTHFAAFFRRYAGCPPSQAR